jgi:hypothetical protein
MLRQLSGDLINTTGGVAADHGRELYHFADAKFVVWHGVSTARPKSVYGIITIAAAVYQAIMGEERQFASGFEAVWRRKRSVSVHESPAPKADAQKRYAYNY